MIGLYFVVWGKSRERRVEAMELEGNIISGESDSSPIRSIDIRDVLQEALLNGANADK